MKYKCKIEITDEEGYNAIIQGYMIGLESEIEYTQIIDDNHAVEMFGFPITKTIYKVGFEGTPQIGISDRFYKLFESLGMYIGGII